MSFVHFAGPTVFKSFFSVTTTASRFSALNTPTTSFTYCFVSSMSCTWWGKFAVKNSRTGCGMPFVLPSTIAGVKEATCTRHNTGHKSKSACTVNNHVCHDGTDMRRAPQARAEGARRPRGRKARVARSRRALQARGARRRRAPHVHRRA